MPSLVLNSHQTLVQIKAAEEAGEIALADELSVAAIGANSKTDYSISLLAALATKKKGSKAEDLAHMVTICLSEWERLGERERGPITTLQHDGASIMNQTVFPCANCSNSNPKPKGSSPGLPQPHAVVV